MFDDQPCGRYLCPLPEANARYADNPWVTAVLESIRKLALPRAVAEFMKEASYSP